MTIRVRTPIHGWQTVPFFFLIVFASDLLAADGPILDLRDGDRVVLLGSAFIEQEGKHGYIETALTSRFADRNLVFRNLGWSGDTVSGNARSYFGPPEEGFQRLKEQLQQIKPTVVLFCTGAVESFGGSEKLPEYQAGLNRMLDMLAATGARIVLLTPPPFERVSERPSVETANGNLRVYADVIRSTAQERKLGFADFRAAVDQATAGPMTNNGINFTPVGYWRVAPILCDSLGIHAEPARVTLDIAKRSHEAHGTSVEQLMVAGRTIQFVLRDRFLPAPPRPAVGPRERPERSALPDGSNALLPKQILVVGGLTEGSYQLQFDGRGGTVASAEDWSKGVSIPAARSAEAQTEKLRQAIVQKNELFFHRWRPQNETYLFGFRKHEQGNNAVEIPQFDALVESAEKRIADLRQPKPITYTLIRISKDAKP